MTTSANNRETKANYLAGWRPCIGHGIPVAVTLFDTNGVPMTRSGSYNPKDLVVSARTDSSGSLRLEVRSVDKSSATGQYQLQLSRVGPPTQVTELPTARDAGRLAPGKRIERGIAQGQVDSFAVDLKAGEFLHVVVEKKAVDVNLALVGPQGAVISGRSGMSNLTGRWGARSMSVIVETTGLYRVRVSSLGSAPPGKYVVSMADLRKPSPQDRERIFAERMQDEATMLAVQPDGS
jgi:hypothetical protein